MICVKTFVGKFFVCVGEWNSKSMEIFLNFLYEWDSYCEIAKNYLDTTQERLWAWLRRNFEYCYKTPPSRKWSIAMQVVYYGDLANLQNLLRICPPGDDQNIWTIRGNDGSTLLDVAEILNQEKYRASEAVAAKIHEIYEFVRIRTLEPNRQQTPAVVVPAVDPNDPLSHVRSIWAEITATKVSRGEGECSIMYCGTEPLYSCSRDCNHAFSKEGLCSFIQSTLRTGPFPVHCPGCTTISSAHDRGLITRGPIKGLVQEGVIQEIDGMRLLHQQIRYLADEPSIDLQFSLSKLCPFCSAPVAHYKYHGIHHISPMGGCSNCQKHFCFSCLQSNGDGTYWEGCPSGCHVNCSNDCDCPLCPDCKLNESCQFCYGCPKCYPGRY